MNNLVDYTITNKDNGYVIAPNQRIRIVLHLRVMSIILINKGSYNVRISVDSQPKSKEKSESGADGDGYSF